MQADKEENDDLITELQHELLTLKDKKNLHEDWEDWATNEKQPSIKSAMTSSINVVPDPNSNPCGAPKETQTQAKLAKELIKLGSTYKVPELKKLLCHLNYQGWITRLHPILAMFPETASMLNQEDIIPFIPADCIGNNALFLLISSRVDNYFQ
jgi:hypothetical protein